MPIYNNPAIGQSLENIASLFAPPSAQDSAAYADAGLKRQKQSIIDKLRSDPRYAGADAGVLADLFDPVNSWQAQDQNNATAQRGQDVRARTDITTNADTVRGSTISSLFGALNQGQVRPAVPTDVARTVGLPEILAAAGAPKPLSETEVKGGLLTQQLPANPPQLTNDQVVALTMGATPVENIVDAQGRPRTVLRAQAVGNQPAYAPNATIMSDGLPKPPDGAVWKTGPDGKPVLDERGAPIAIPYQGGALFDKQAAQDKAAVGTSLQQDLVLNTVDTALDQVKANPNLATGLGSQLTGGLGGGPANDLAQTLSTIKSNISFDKLQAMRMASPTGGALGNVSDTDLRLLMATYGSLEQSQSDDQLARNLQIFKQVYYDTINGPGEYAKKQQADAAAVSAGPALPPGVTEDDIQHTMQIHGLTREQVLARLGGT